VSLGRENIQPGGSRMRASDADRDRTIETLATANAEGRLSLEEYSQRSDAALTALTLGDLARLTTDLPAPPPGGATPIPEKITAVLGNEVRKGRWVVPPYLAVRSVLGDCHLELQRAVIRQQITTIHVSVRFGSVTIYVPDGVDVRLTGRAVFSAKSSDLRSEPKPGAPVLIVRCDLFCGAVNVRRPAMDVRGAITAMIRRIGDS
jgi:hypothetical protein